MCYCFKTAKMHQNLGILLLSIYSRKKKNWGVGAKVIVVIAIKSNGKTAIAFAPTHIYPLKDSYLNIHRDITHNCQELEITQIINQQMDNQTAV